MALYNEIPESIVEPADQTAADETKKDVVTVTDDSTSGIKSQETVSSQDVETKNPSSTGLVYNRGREVRTGPNLDGSEVGSTMDQFLRGQGHFMNPDDYGVKLTPEQKAEAQRRLDEGIILADAVYPQLERDKVLHRLYFKDDTVPATTAAPIGRNEIDPDIAKMASRVMEDTTMTDSEKYRMNRALSVIADAKKRGLKIVRSDAGRYWIEGENNGVKEYSLNGIAEVKDLLDKYYIEEKDTTPVTPDDDKTPEDEKKKVTSKKTTPEKKKPELPPEEEYDDGFNESELAYLFSFGTDVASTLAGLGLKTTGVGGLWGVGVGLVGGLISAGSNFYGDLQNDEVSAGEMWGNLGTRVALEAAEAVSFAPASVLANLAKGGRIVKLLNKTYHIAMGAGLVKTATSLELGNTLKKIKEGNLSDLDVDDYANLATLVNLAASFAASGITSRALKKNLKKTHAATKEPIDIGQTSKIRTGEGEVKALPPKSGGGEKPGLPPARPKPGQTDITGQVPLTPPAKPRQPVYGPETNPANKPTVRPKKKIESEQPKKVTRTEKTAEEINSRYNELKEGVKRRTDLTKEQKKTAIKKLEARRKKKVNSRNSKLIPRPDKSKSSTTTGKSSTTPPNAAGEKTKVRNVTRVTSDGKGKPNVKVKQITKKELVAKEKARRQAEFEKAQAESRKARGKSLHERSMKKITGEGKTTTKGGKSVPKSKVLKTEIAEKRVKLNKLKEQAKKAKGKSKDNLDKKIEALKTDITEVSGRYKKAVKFEKSKVGKVATKSKSLIAKGKNKAKGIGKGVVNRADRTLHRAMLNTRKSISPMKRAFEEQALSGHDNGILSKKDAVDVLTQAGYSKEDLDALSQKQLNRLIRYLKKKAKEEADKPKKALKPKKKETTKKRLGGVFEYSKERLVPKAQKGEIFSRIKDKETLDVPTNSHIVYNVVKDKPLDNADYSEPVYRLYYFDETTGEIRTKEGEGITEEQMLESVKIAKAQKAIYDKMKKEEEDSNNKGNNQNTEGSNNKGTGQNVDKTHNKGSNSNTAPDDKAKEQAELERQYRALQEKYKKLTSNVKTPIIPESLSRLKPSDFMWNNELFVERPAQRDIGYMPLSTRTVRNMPGFEDAYQQAGIVRSVDTSDPLVAATAKLSQYNQGQRERTKLIANNAAYVDNIERENLGIRNQNISGMTSAMNANINRFNTNEAAYAQSLAAAKAARQADENKREGRLWNTIADVGREYATKSSKLNHNRAIADKYRDLMTKKNIWDTEYAPRVKQYIAEGDTNEVKRMKVLFDKEYGYNPDNFLNDISVLESQFIK